MPSCNPCGLGVEWLHTSYSSEWHFFRDAPEVKTPGRFYVVPNDTEDVPVYHHFGSRRWYDQNWDKLQSLGEDLIAKQVWNNGEPPELIPRREIVGMPGCLTAGELFADRLPYDQFWDGFPRACFFPNQLVDNTWPLVSSTNSCTLQFFYATILAWMYIKDWHSIEVAFELLVPDCLVYHREGNAIFPNLVCVVTDAWCVVVSDGTQTYQQWALQGFYGISSPEEFGLFSTLRLWYDASTNAVNFMRDCLVNPFGKFMFVGHSYGGAVANLLAARVIAAGPLRTISVLTFGAPKGGDSRLRSLLYSVNSLQLANEQDIVCSVPPDLPILWPVLVETGLFDIAVWAAWEGPPGRGRMNADGDVAMNLEPVLDSNTLLRMLGQIIDQEPIFDIVTHPVTVYRRRIMRRCPSREWPVSLELYNWLKRFDLAALVELEIGPAHIEFPNDVVIIGGAEPPKVLVFVGEQSPYGPLTPTELVIGAELVAVDVKVGGAELVAVDVKVGGAELVAVDVKVGGELPGVRVVVGGELPGVRVVISDESALDHSPLTGVVVGGDLPGVGLVVGTGGELPGVGLVVGGGELPGVRVVVGGDLPGVGLVVGAGGNVPSSEVITGEDVQSVPGGFCSTAMDLPIGSTWSYTTSTVDQQWYRFPSPPSGTAHIRLTTTLSPFEATTLYYGFSCVSQFYLANLSSGIPCADFSGGIYPYFWLQFPATISPVAYIIEYDVGNC